MKFLQKRTVAIAVMVLAMIGAIVIGQAKKPDTSAPPHTAILGSYTYVHDDSDVLSDKTIQYIVAMNESLFAQTGAQIMVQTVDSTGNLSIEDYAIELGNRYQVGDEYRDNGLVLVLALKNISSGGLVGDYWVEPGDGIYNYVNELDNMCRAYLEEDFADGMYDAGVRKTFDAFIGWFEDLYDVDVRQNYIPATKQNFSAGNYQTQTIGYVESSAGDIIGGLIMLMIVLLVIWVIADAIRWNRYRSRYMRPGMGIPTVTYRPVFWGRPRRRVVVPPRNTQPPSGGFGGGPSRRPPSGGGYRPPSGGSRPSAGRGSFGGGGSFGGSGASRRSGGRSSFGGSSFGGSSRSSGGRSSFGGGGSFGGSRGGGRSGGGRSGGGRGR